MLRAQVPSHPHSARLGLWKIPEQAAPIAQGGAVFFWGRLSKLGPEGSRHGGSAQLEQQLWLRAPLGPLVCTREGGPAPDPSLSAGSTAHVPKASRVENDLALSGSSPLSRARQRPDGLWETLQSQPHLPGKPTWQFCLVDTHLSLTFCCHLPTTTPMS